MSTLSLHVKSADSRYDFVTIYTQLRLNATQTYELAEVVKELTVNVFVQSILSQVALHPLSPSMDFMRSCFASAT